MGVLVGFLIKKLQGVYFHLRLAEFISRGREKEDESQGKITVDANKNTLIATIISKQSQARGTLDLMGYEQVDSICFRLMQIHRDCHALKGTAFNREHIDEGSTRLIHRIKTTRNWKPDWSERKQMEGALVGYVSELEKVPLDRPEDSETRTKDVFKNVIARAQFFTTKGYII